MFKHQNSFSIVDFFGLTAIFFIGPLYPNKKQSLPQKEEEKVAQEEEKEEKKVEEKEEVEELLPPETPKYGGTFTFIYPEPFGFDPANRISVEVRSALGGFTHNEMMMGDWTKGPLGTGETDWQNGYLGRIGLETGCLAESWELTDDETIIYHLRKGVHYFMDPDNEACKLVGGRELVADDVVWSMEREWTSPKSFLFFQMKPEEKPKSFTALDKYTVELKVPSGVQGALLFLTGDQCHIYAPEVVDKWGSYDDWRHQVGTGPFMLTSYVGGSSLTYVRNPNFFLNDPFHPENQLPYLDMCKQLIITDKSTQLAALSTGKIDFSLNVPINSDDRDELLKSAPELQTFRTAGVDEQVWARADKDLPCKDVRVRQALTLAIDQPGLVEDYYNGNADLLGHPFPPYKAWEALYTPLEEMPANVQELFTHNPEKAKQLLAEAGYPNGFKMQIDCGTAEQADFLSIIKSYFGDVGVDLQINFLENTVYRSVLRGRTYEDSILCTCPTAGFPWKMHSTRLTSLDDKSFYSSPTTDEAFAEENQYVGKDDAKWQAIVKGVTPFILEQCVGIWVPVPHGFRMWWPWLQNYHGEGTLGYDNQMAVSWYVWVDEAMKSSMGY